jgi:chromosome segregation ATPase
MTTDITELATVLRLAAESEIAYRAEGDTSDLWQDEASPDNVLALVEALEKAQTKAVEQGRTACELFDEVTTLRQRIAELENDEVRQRLANAEHQLHMAGLRFHNIKASRNAQFKKRKEAEQRIAELESRTVKLPKRSVGEVMHMSGFSRDYAEGWCAGNDNAIHEMRVAGIKVEVE